MSRTRRYATAIALGAVLSAGYGTAVHAAPPSTTVVAQDQIVAQDEQEDDGGGSGGTWGLLGLLGLLGLGGLMKGRKQPAGRAETPYRDTNR